MFITSSLWGFVFKNHEHQQLVYAVERLEYKFKNWKKYETNTQTKITELHEIAELINTVVVVVVANV